MILVKMWHLAQNWIGIYNFEKWSQQRLVINRCGGDAIFLTIKILIF